MHRTHSLISLAFVAAAPVLAQPNPQDVPDIPRPAEIQERMKKIFAEAPEETVEVAGVAKLTYRRVWLDAHALALKFGGTLTGKEQPRGIPLDRYVKQFEPRMEQCLAEELLDIGGLELLVPMTLKKKPVPAGKYRIGLVLQEGKPAGIVVKGDDLNKGKPLSLKLKKQKSEDPPEAEGQLRLKLVGPEEQVAEQEKFDLLVRAIGGDAATTGPVFVRAAEKAEKGAAKEEDEDEGEKKEMDKKK